MINVNDYGSETENRKLNASENLNIAKDHQRRMFSARISSMFISVNSTLGWCLSASSWQQPKDSLWGSCQGGALANQQLLLSLAVWAEGSIKYSRMSWLRAALTGLEKLVDQHQQMTWQPTPSLTVETSHWNSGTMDSGTLIS